MLHFSNSAAKEQKQRNRDFRCVNRQLAKNHNLNHSGGAATGRGRVGDSENLSDLFDDGRRHPTSTGMHFDPIGFV